MNQSAVWVLNRKHPRRGSTRVFLRGGGGGGSKGGGWVGGGGLWGDPPSGDPELSRGGGSPLFLQCTAVLIHPCPPPPLPPPIRPLSCSCRPHGDSSPQDTSRAVTAPATPRESLHVAHATALVPRRLLPAGQLPAFAAFLQLRFLILSHRFVTLNNCANGGGCPVRLLSPMRRTCALPAEGGTPPPPPPSSHCLPDGKCQLHWHL